MTKRKSKNVETLLEGLLKEAQPIQRPTSMADFTPATEVPLSLDQAVDRYLVQYERESIPTSEMFESTKVETLVNYLFEQDAAPDDEDEGDDELDLGVDDDADTGGLDLGGAEDDASTDNSDTEDDTPPVMNVPKINLQDFTRSIARLVNNLGSLIDLNTIILNRAGKYIENNYDERTAKEMLEILDTTYDLRPVSNEEKAEEASEHPNPTTAVTGPVGG